VRSESAAAAAKQQQASQQSTAEAMGGAKDFSALGEAGVNNNGVPATGFGSAGYLPYRPYVTLASMVALFVGLIMVLSPVCEVCCHVCVCVRVCVLVMHVFVMHNV